MELKNVLVAFIKQQLGCFNDNLFHNFSLLLPKLDF